MATNDPAYPPPLPGQSEHSSAAGQSKAYADAPPPYMPPTGGGVGGGAAAPSIAPYPPKGAPYAVNPPYPPTTGGSPGHVQLTPQQAGVVVHQVTHISQGTVGVTGMIGNCPSCHIGTLTEDFSTIGILMAFFFFPFGILCCMMMRVKRCPSCGTTFN